MLLNFLLFIRNDQNRTDLLLARVRFGCQSFLQAVDIDLIAESARIKSFPGRGGEPCRWECRRCRFQGGESPTPIWGRPREAVGTAVGEGLDAHLVVGDLRGLDKDALQAGVGIEGLSLGDA